MQIPIELRFEHCIDYSGYLYTVQMKSQAKPKPPLKARESYHHGDLRVALVRAAEEIIDSDGIEGFSLREAARRAGVSPGAPGHHFGSVVGLLTEVAILAFEALEQHLSGIPTSKNPVRNLHAVATAYIDFAQRWPGRFRLMFREGLTDWDDPRRTEASVRALEKITYACAGVHGIKLESLWDGLKHPILISNWVTIHGLAHVALEGQMVLAFRTHGDKRPDLFNRVLPDLLKAQWPLDGAPTDASPKPRPRRR
jgi:AcrR family transcriptional regulator